MIEQSILDKHGLKQIKFSDLIDGEEFNIPEDFHPELGCLPEHFRRKLVGQNVIYADGKPMCIPEDVSIYPENGRDDIVYVRV